MCCRPDDHEGNRRAQQDWDGESDQNFWRAEHFSADPFRLPQEFQAQFSRHFSAGLFVPMRKEMTKSLAEKAETMITWPMPVIPLQLSIPRKLVVWAKSSNGFMLRVVLRIRGSAESCSAVFFLN